MHTCKSEGAGALQRSHLWDVLNEAFWDQDNAIILAFLSSLCDHVCNLGAQVALYDQYKPQTSEACTQSHKF